MLRILAFWDDPGRDCSCVYNAVYIQREETPANRTDHLFRVIICFLSNMMQPEKGRSQSLRAMLTKPCPKKSAKWLQSNTSIVDKAPGTVNQNWKVEGRRVCPGSLLQHGLRRCSVAAYSVQDHCFFFFSKSTPRIRTMRLGLKLEAARPEPWNKERIY